MHSLPPGAEKVLDKDYRDALVLTPSQFALSFHPSEHGILEEIQQFFASDFEWIAAKIHKINIYKKGNFFKEHVDTPLGSKMIGSLVVCLPCAHEGGALVVSHVCRGGAVRRERMRERRTKKQRGRRREEQENERKASGMGGKDGGKTEGWEGRKGRRREEGA
jgi:hypothetical protein